MNNHDLHLFATAARLGSITKAARALATVQSNVTTRIRLLEEELGVKLFHRNRTGITLTGKGQELLPYAEQMATLLQKAREKMSRSQQVEGQLRIGSLQTTASVRLPGILKTYLSKYERVDLAIETGTAPEMMARVLDHGVDGAFVTGPVHHPDLEAFPAFVEEMVLVTPAAYQTVKGYLARGPIAKVLVFKQGCYYRKALEKYLSRAGVDMLQEMEFGTLDGILGCVSAGLGMTLMPKSVVEHSALRKKVRAHRLGKEGSRVEIQFITYKATIRATALERFLDVVRGAAGE